MTVNREQSLLLGRVAVRTLLPLFQTQEGGEDCGKIPPTKSRIEPLKSECGALNRMAVFSRAPASPRLRESDSRPLSTLNPQYPDQLPLVLSPVFGSLARIGDFTWRVRWGVFVIGAKLGMLVMQPGRCVSITAAHPRYLSLPATWYSLSFGGLSPGRC